MSTNLERKQRLVLMHFYVLIYGFKLKCFLKNKHKEKFLLIKKLNIFIYTGKNAHVCV